MDLKPELLTSLIATVGILLGAGLTYLGSYIEHRRRTTAERRQEYENEQAVFHGAFALCNFLAGKLNEWDEKSSLQGLARLKIAQPYLAKLIDRSPQNSDRLMVALVDLGLRLESLLAVISQVLNSELHKDVVDSDLALAVQELGSAIEFVQILVSGELPFISDEELAELTQPGEETKA